MPVDDSRLSGFYRLDPEARRALLSHLSPEALEALSSGGGLDEASADRMIENVVGSLALPVGIATNFYIDGKHWLIPFAVEESSIIAAASNIAKRAASCGGFSTSCDEPLMIGQIQVLDVPSIPEATSAIQAEEASLIEFLNDVPSTMIRLGGGCKRIECRQVEDMLILHLIVDVRDAMGANAVNTMAERIAPRIEALTGGRVLLRILSNLASERLARASVRLSPDAIGGEDVIADIIDAARFAEADPYRAATHNKGIMNAISAIGMACGQDWRAIEAGAHAWAAQSGQYRSLSTWSTDDEGWLCGSIELPLAVGIVGGASSVHPVARACLEILGVDSAQQLAGIMAAAGLAQNLGAMRALVTSGIQAGHMKLHLRNMAVSAGAEGDEIETVVNTIRKSGEVVTQTAVVEALTRIRQR
jgi:hydroxymethylglutaryl-CoA reductase